MLQSIMIKCSSILPKILELMVPVVIAAGRDTASNELDDAEIVDNNTNCKVSPIPMKLYGATGINGMVCGGLDYNFNFLSSCWHLNPSGTWTAGEDMLYKRVYFTMTAVEDEIIVIGGQTAFGVGLKSVEKYSPRKYEGWLKMKHAPQTIAGHCTVRVNTTYLMAIGGNQNEVIKDNIKMRTKLGLHVVPILIAKLL